MKFKPRLRANPSRALRLVKLPLHRLQPQSVLGAEPCEPLIDLGVHARGIELLLRPVHPCVHVRPTLGTKRSFEHRNDPAAGRGKLSGPAGF